MRLSVRVIAHSSRNTLEWEQGGIKARLTAKPVNGAANEALIALLAERLSLPKYAISIVRGATSRQKIVEIEGLTVADVEQRVKNSDTK